MAPLAAEPPIARMREILHLLAPSEGRAEFATRVALICALVTLDAQIYDIADGALIAYVVFFLNKPDRAASIVTSLLLLIVFTITIAMTIAITFVVLDDALWRVTAIVLVSFLMLFLASASKLRPVGAIIALIAGYGLDVLGMTPGGELAVRGLLEAWLFVGIPAAISIVVNLLIAPPPRRKLQRALAHRLRLSSAMLRRPAPRTRGAFQECLGEGAAELHTWLKLAGAERTSPKRDLAALKQATDSTLAILLLVDLIDRSPNDLLPSGERAELARVLGEMASILQAGGYPVEIALDPPTTAPTSSLAASVRAGLRAAITKFAEPPPPEAAPPPPPKAAGGFFLPDAFTNPGHVLYALKTTGAATFCYVLYSLLDWNGIHTAFITCYIVSLGTAAESIEKLTLRILGCLLGAALGIGAIVVVIPHLTSIGVLMALVFAGAFISAWIAAGPPRIAYAGFQLAFAFFLCVIQGSAPSLDMQTARDRIIGILLGNLVCYLVFTTISPVSVVRQIDPAIAALLRKLRAILSAGGQPARHALAADAITSHAALERDLELVPYEPSGLRPPRDWLLRRRRAADNILALTAPLMLSASDDGPRTQDVRERLERLAASLASGPPAAEQSITPPPSGPPKQDLPAVIEAHLASLQLALGRDPGVERPANLAPA